MGRRMTKDPRLVRIDPTRLRVSERPGRRRDAVRQRSGADRVRRGRRAGRHGRVRETAERLAEHDPALFDAPPALAKVAVTPDFHKGVGIPIGTVMATAGFVVPQAIGNDINCGMRLHLTSLKADQVVGRLDELETRCRHIYFEGGPRHPDDARPAAGDADRGAARADERRAPVAPGRALVGVQRAAVRPRSGAGPPGRGAPGGPDVRAGRLPRPAEGANRDGQIGSIGGGNHFVEVQRVARIIDGATAHAWGLREGQVTVMVHSGSLSIGHHCGTRVRDMLRKVFPAGVRHPDNGIFLIPTASGTATCRSGSGTRSGTRPTSRSPTG
jgi:tRNA-splicing ligase RtcB